MMADMKAQDADVPAKTKQSSHIRSSRRIRPKRTTLVNMRGTVLL